MVPMLSERSKVNTNWEFDDQAWVLSLVNTRDEHPCCELEGHSQIVVEGKLPNGEVFVMRFDIVRHGNTSYTIRDHKGYSAKDYSKLESTQWFATPTAVHAMIRSIRDDQRDLENLRKHDEAHKTNFADVIYRYEKAGSKRWTWLLGGNGGENCVTWAEKKLALAWSGNRGKVFDLVGASPRIHTKLSTQNMLKIAVPSAVVAGIKFLLTFKK